MYSKLLVATDGSALAHKGIEQGISLAKALGAELIFLTVSESMHAIGAGAALVAESSFDPMPEIAEDLREVAQRTLNSASIAAKAEGLVCTALYMTDVHPAEAIIATAGVLISVEK